MLNETKPGLICDAHFPRGGRSHEISPVLPMGSPSRLVPGAGCLGAGVADGEAGGGWALFTALGAGYLGLIRE